MRVLKGKEGLPDDSTLDEHNITEGDVLNIITEPDKDINIQVRCGAETLPVSISYCTIVNTLKHLISIKIMIFSLSEFDLVQEQNETLYDTTLPLHFYGIKNGSILRVIKSDVGIVVENRKGQEMFVSISRKATIGDLRDKILKCTTVQLVDMFTAFVNPTGPKMYRKLADDSVCVGDVLYDHARVYAIECSFHTDRVTQDGMYQDNSKKIYGLDFGDTVISVKLRGQDQLGIPVHKISVKKGSQTQKFSVVPDNRKLDVNRVHKVEYAK